MMIMNERRAAALAVHVYLHPKPSTITSYLYIAAVLVYDIRHAIERAGMHPLFDVCFVIATAKKTNHVFVFGQKFGAVLYYVVEVRNAFVFWAQVAIASARIPFALHQVEPIAENKYRRIRGLGFV